METAHLSDQYNDLAPDGSEIRLLTKVHGGIMVHCSLPPGDTSSAVKHKTVEELWYCVEGSGEVWRKLESENQDEVIQFKPGISVSIPVGSHFQFRNLGKSDLRFIIVTMPPWPGDSEAIKVQGKW